LHQTFESPGDFWALPWDAAQRHLCSPGGPDSANPFLSNAAEIWRCPHQPRRRLLGAAYSLFKPCAFGNNHDDPSSVVRLNLMNNYFGSLSPYFCPLYPLYPLYPLSAVDFLGSTIFRRLGMPDLTLG